MYLTNVNSSKLNKYPWDKNEFRHQTLRKKIIWMWFHFNTPSQIAPYRLCHWLYNVLSLFWLKSSGKCCIYCMFGYRFRIVCRFMYFLFESRENQKRRAEYQKQECWSVLYVQEVLAHFIYYVTIQIGSGLLRQRVAPGSSLIQF